MAKIVILAGPHAVGKSSIAASFKEKGYNIVNMGNLMAKEGIRRGFVKDRDQIRKLPTDENLELVKHAYAQIARMKGNVIIDTHAFVLRTPLKRYMTGLPLQFIERLKKITALIYIDAKPEEIIERIQKDRSRKRTDLLDEELIREERELNLEAMSFLAIHLNVPLYFINNRQGKLKDSIEKMGKIIDEIYG